MEQQATRVWYDNFTNEGLNWGPQFAVMEEDVHSKRLAAVLDLIVHKWPNMRILELGGQPEVSGLFMDVLRVELPLRRSSSYVRGIPTAKGELLGLEAFTGEISFAEDIRTAESLPMDKKFDLVIFSEVLFIRGWLRLNS